MQETEAVSRYCQPGDRTQGSQMPALASLSAVPSSSSFHWNVLDVLTVSTGPEADLYPPSRPSHSRSQHLPTTQQQTWYTRSCPKRAEPCCQKTDFEGTSHGGRSRLCCRGGREGPAEPQSWTEAHVERGEVDRHPRVPL